MKSPIRWAGSKRKSLKILEALSRSRSGKYIEAFCGSACLFFATAPPKAILGDLNPELIRAFRSLRDDFSSVKRELLKIRCTEKDYYSVRALDPERMVASAAAARFFYLNRYCFNGLYRTNRAGKFNVPFGHLKKNESIDYKVLEAASDRLKSATLMNCDFDVALDEARSGDFVYLDPPYVTSEGKRLFSEYLSNSFAVSDLHRLADCLATLDKKDVKFAVSYADCKESRNCFKGWRILTNSVRRNIAGFAGHRKLANELIATNIEADLNEA